MATRDGITSVTAHGRVKYRARFSFTDDSGKRRHRTKTFETKKAAQAWLTERRRELNRGEYTDPSAVTVAEVAVRWLAAQQRGKAGSTAMHYRRWYERTVAPRFGDRRVGGVSPTEIQTFYDELGERYRGGTVGMVHKVVRGIFRRAVTEGLIRTNPADDRSVPKDQRPEPAVWTPEEARRFLDHAGTTDKGTLYTFLLATGLRLGEALALRWEDVDLAVRTATIHRTLQITDNGAELADRTKTASSMRTIVLPETAVRVLEPMRQETGIVFPGARGGLRPVSRVRDDLIRLCEDAGVPRMTPHGLRRYCATMMLARGVPPSVAAKQLGHSVSQMLTRYARVDTSLQAQAAAAIDVSLAGPDGDD